MSAPAPVPALQEAARLLAEGRPMLAAERLGALVAEAPIYAAAHVLRATALEAAGRVDEALVAWGRAAALVPRSPLVHRERERLLAVHVAAAEPALPPAEPDPDAARTHAPTDAAPPEPAAEPPPPDLAPLPPLGDPGTPDLSAGLPADEVHADTLDALDDVDRPLTDFGAPPPAADESAQDEPAPAESGPDERDVDEPDAAGYGAPQTLDASDLVAAPPPAPRPPDPALEDAAPTADAAADDPGEASASGFPYPPPAFPPGGDPDPFAWDAAATILPPETRDPVDLPDLPAGDPFGWDVVSETDVPTPPPGTTAEPDVVAPEGAPPEPPAVADELDALIAQLEDAPRIRPDPAYGGPAESLDHPEVDDLASETLAKIYAAQHQYVEAAVVYEKLAARRPDEAEDLLRRAAELRERGA